METSFCMKRLFRTLKKLCVIKVSGHIYAILTYV
jgi:hypothetical protein